MQKKTLTLLITSVISASSYAQITINNDGSFTTPNKSISQSSIEEKAEELVNNANLLLDNSSTPIITTNDYYAIDANGNPVTENNTVVVDGLIDLGTNVYGGYCDTPTRCEIKNTNIVMKAGSVSLLYGAKSYTDSSKVIGNVYITNGNVEGTIYGASATSSNEVTGNVYMTNGSVQGEIYGADSFLSEVTTGNIYITDGNIRGDIYGARSLNGDNPFSIVTGGVYIAGGEMEGNLYGVLSSFSSFSSSSPASTSQVIGDVYMSGGNVQGNITGGYSNSNSSSASSHSKTEGNVYMTGGNVQGDIYGAWSLSSLSSSETTGNVYITKGSVQGSVYGTNSITYDSSSVTATGNVYINSAYVQGNIYGINTYSDSYHTASGNVYLYGDVKLQNDITGQIQYNSSIWGSYLANGISNYYNILNGNLLSVASGPLTVTTVGNFANYNFYINDYNKHLVVNNITGNGGTGIITVTDSMQNNNTVVDDGNGGSLTTNNKSEIHVAGISGVTVLNKGQSIILIDASGSNSFILGDDTSATVSNISDIFTTQTGNVDYNVQVGLVGEADVSYIVDGSSNKIIAVIDDLRVSQNGVNKSVKPLAESRLATLENVTRGADLLFNLMGDNKPAGTITPFAIMDGGINKYNSGSHINSSDYRLMGGARYQVTENIYTGLALEYGHSNYNTHNEFNSTMLRGDGNTYNYGASLFTKYTDHLEFGDMYIDGAFRFGRTSTDFDSSDIVTGSGDFAHYKSRVNYVGTNVGTGFIYALNEISSLDSSIRYLWTRLGSDSVIIDGNKVNFDTATSSRIQFKEQYNYKHNDSLTFSLAGIYEYEFNGEANANVSGVAVDAPSVKGSTGIMELGVKGTPLADNEDFSFNLSFKGYGGKRDGASASLFIQYDF